MVFVVWEMFILICFIYLYKSCIMNGVIFIGYNKFLFWLGFMVYSELNFDVFII